MEFPVYIRLGGWGIHPHVLFETLAYFIGFRTRVGYGTGLTVLLHMLLILFPPAIFAIGIVQWIYILPAVLIAMKKGNKRLGQGLLIGAGITFLVNTTCFGLVMGGVWYPF